MDAFRQAVDAEAQQLLRDLPAQAARVHTLVAQRCAERAPSALSARFSAQIGASPARVAANGEVAALAAVAGDELERLLGVLQKLQLWISLRVPRIEDGNNFGVEVQKAAFSLVKEAAAAWQKAFDALPDYHQQRATAVEKVNAKRSSEKSATTTSSKTTGSETEDKTVATVVEKTSEAVANDPGALQDAIAHVIALDVKWFANLARTLEGVRDQYAVVFDVIDKNKDKIELPRGSGDRAGFSMF